MRLHTDSRKEFFENPSKKVRGLGLKIILCLDFLLIPVHISAPIGWLSIRDCVSSTFQNGILFIHSSVHVYFGIHRFWGGRSEVHLFNIWGQDFTGTLRAVMDLAMLIIYLVEPRCSICTLNEIWTSGIHGILFLHLAVHRLRCLTACLLSKLSSKKTCSSASYLMISGIEYFCLQNVCFTTGTTLWQSSVLRFFCFVRAAFG